MKELDKSKLIDFNLERMGSERDSILERWQELVGDK